MAKASSPLILTIPIPEVLIAVEIAEEDMIEKAVKAFAEACEMYAGTERCLECVKCKDCERVKEFRQRLEKP